MLVGVLLDLDTRTFAYFKNEIQLPLADNNLKYYPAISCNEAGNWVGLSKTNPYILWKH